MANNLTFGACGVEGMIVNVFGIESSALYRSLFYRRRQNNLILLATASPYQALLSALHQSDICRKPTHIQPVLIENHQVKLSFKGY